MIGSPDSRRSLKIAVQHYQKGELSQVEQICFSILEQQPNQVEALQLLGIIACKTGLLEEGIAHYRRVIALRPDLAETYYNLGKALKEQGKFEEAVAHFQQAIAKNTNFAEAEHNLGHTLQQLGQLEEAIACYNHVLELNPQFIDARWNRSLALLLSGDFIQGFADYEYRWQQAEFLKNNPRPPYSHSLWDGAHLNGQTILIHVEQGFGDAIQFIRYVPLIQQRGGRLMVGCRAPLLRLFSTISGIERLVGSGGFIPEFDVYVPLMSLPHLLGTTLETIPAKIPYLAAPESKILLKTPPGTQKKVGMAWAAGNKDQSLLSQRSCKLSHFLPLLSTPGIAFYSLQKGPRVTDLEQLDDHKLLQDLSNQLRNFADTAAAITQLDIVITVDTAVAHLAGALGKPVWVLLPFAPDWRWMLGRDDSPWYPTMRLFRQERPMDWTGVFKQVTEALQNWAN